MVESAQHIKEVVPLICYNGDYSKNDKFDDLSFCAQDASKVKRVIQSSNIAL
jgi:hypothetical protein